ncbi:MAG: VOC family protein [Proteobacteria bacterium]|nr:VOC family protein [Pseudomonadota bacterium]
MPQAIPYLSFDGQCAEAMCFYERVLGLGARIELMLSGTDTPMAAQMPKEFAHRIMHCRLAFADGSHLYAGDAPGHLPYGGMKGIGVALNYPTVAEAERAFRALADGGQVSMPLAPTFWARSFGMLTDRYGTPWLINGEPIPVQAPEPSRAAY